MSDAPKQLNIKARLNCGSEIAMGPGKADLLDAIDHEGSISAAGRALGMSYRRTWLLVDTMNRCWDEPLVETVAGGRADRGARLTALGRAVLDQYRQLEARIDLAAQSDDLEVLLTRLCPVPKPSQKN